MTKTLSEQADIITNTDLQVGVIQTIVRESAVLELLPFEYIKGDALAYIQNTDLGSVGFRKVGESYELGAGEYEGNTERLTRLGALVETDRFIHATQNINNVRAEETANKAKAIANTFTNTFFNGDITKDSNSFNGLINRVTEQQTLDAVGYNLHTGLLHHVLDMVDGGADVLFMNKRTRRKLTIIFASQTAWVHEGQDAFGRPIQFFGDTRIAVVDDYFLPNNDIYAVKFGMSEGVTGIQAGDIVVEDNGLRGVSYQTLVEWFPSIVVGNPNGVARLHGLTI